MEDVSLPLAALLRPLLALTALATESHRDLTHSCHTVMCHDMRLTLMHEVSTKEVSRNLVEQLVSNSVRHSVAPDPEQFFTRGLKKGYLYDRISCSPTCSS